MQLKGGAQRKKMVHLYTEVQMTNKNIKRKSWFLRRQVAGGGLQRRYGQDLAKSILWRIIKNGCIDCMLLSFKWIESFYIYPWSTHLLTRWSVRIMLETFLNIAPRFRSYFYVWKNIIHNRKYIIVFFLRTPHQLLNIFRYPSGNDRELARAAEIYHRLST